MADPISVPARELVWELGPTLVATLAGTKDRTAPQSWADGTAEPDEHEAERLRAASESWHVVAAADGPDVARAWFIGMNPWLGDVTPVSAIREGKFAQVRAAAQAAAKDTFSG